MSNAIKHRTPTCPECRKEFIKRMNDPNSKRFIFYEERHSVGKDFDFDRQAGFLRCEKCGWLSEWIDAIDYRRKVFDYIPAEERVEKIVFQSREIEYTQEEIICNQIDLAFFIRFDKNGQEKNPQNSTGKETICRFINKIEQDTGDSRREDRVQNYYKSYRINLRETIPKINVKQITVFENKKLCRNPKPVRA